MREIKFRAWSKGRSKMLTWEELQKLHVHTVFNMLLPECQLMQYTGLKDKDGVEIYEGDILRYVCKSKIETITREVLFIDGCFSVKESDNCDHALGGICSDENHEGSHVGFVIGNVYENPELLS